jgi:DNA transposition AAA+ family ATPase
VPHHYLDLGDATTVETDALGLTRRAVSDVCERRAMGVIHGPAGTGKTFAVEEAVEALPDTWGAMWLRFPSRPTMRLVAAEIHRELTGTDPERRDRFQLTRLLRAELALTPTLLIVDEAQNLNRECIEFLRYLGEDPARQSATLLVGGDGCWGILSREPMLRSRIYRRVTFNPLPAAEMVSAARRFHPLYRDTPDDLLEMIDSATGKGYFRHWARFTLSAVSLMAETRTTRLSERVIRNVATVLGGPDAV